MTLRLDLPKYPDARDYRREFLRLRKMRDRVTKLSERATVEMLIGRISHLAWNHGTVDLSSRNASEAIERRAR